MGEMLKEQEMNNTLRPHCADQRLIGRYISGATNDCCVPISAYEAKYLKVCLQEASRDCGIGAC